MWAVGTEVNVTGSRLCRQALAEPRVNPHLWHQSLCHNQTQWFSLILLLSCSHKYLHGWNKTTLHFCPLRKNNKHLKYFCSFSPSTFLKSWWGEYIFIFLGKEEKKEQPRWSQTPWKPFILQLCLPWHHCRTAQAQLETQLRWREQVSSSRKVFVSESLEHFHGKVVQCMLDYPCQLQFT